MVEAEKYHEIFKPKNRFAVAENRVRKAGGEVYGGAGGLGDEKLEGFVGRGRPKLWFKSFC